MRALPARRLALGALCAALLVGVTGPAAMAADSVHEGSRVASPGTPRTPLAQLEEIEARTHDGDLAPVADLVKAVLGSGSRSLPAAEVRRLGEAAKKALAEAAAEPAETTPVDDTPVIVTLESSAVTSPLVVLPGTDADTDADTEATADAATTEADAAATDADAATDAATDTATATPTDVDSLLDAVSAAVDELVNLLLAADGNSTAQVDSAVDTLVAEVNSLVDTLVGSDPQVSLLPAPAAPAQPDEASLLPAVTLPQSISLLVPAS